MSFLKKLSHFNPDLGERKLQSLRQKNILNSLKKISFISKFISFLSIAITFYFPKFSKITYPIQLAILIFSLFIFGSLNAYIVNKLKVPNMKIREPEDFLVYKQNLITLYKENHYDKIFTNLLGNTTIIFLYILVIDEYRNFINPLFFFSLMISIVALWSIIHFKTELTFVWISIYNFFTLTLTFISLIYLYWISFKTFNLGLSFILSVFIIILEKKDRKAWD